MQISVHIKLISTFVYFQCLSNILYKINDSHHDIPLFWKLTGPHIYICPYVDAVFDAFLVSTLYPSNHQSYTMSNFVSGHVIS